MGDDAIRAAGELGVRAFGHDVAAVGIDLTTAAPSGRVLRSRTGFGSAGTTVLPMTVPATVESAAGRAGQFTFWLSGVWLVFLIDPVARNWPHRDQPKVIVGMVATLVFAGVYLYAIRVHVRLRHRLIMTMSLRQAYAFLVALSALGSVIGFGLGQSGTGAVIYSCVVAALALPTRHALPMIALLSGLTLYSSFWVPGYDRDIRTAAVAAGAGGMMWAVMQIMGRNAELMLVRSENERLVVEQERNRFARDLHDILGHSLTVITVKTELARRLIDIDVSRARAELEDLEALARESLTDVRRAVEGYREITLPGELARARAALTAAGIEHDLPNSTDDVGAEHRELFAWVIREGVTNVIRHSRAGRCRVQMSARRVVVFDDGQGAPGDRGPGNGLSGLRERAAAAGARVSSRNVEPSGFELEVVVA
jgi:two-component system sensor histidine kinase DesK